MNVASFLRSFAVVFALAFLVTVLITFFWNLTVHGESAVEWETAFRFGLILGIVLPVVEKFQKT